MNVEYRQTDRPRYKSFLPSFKKNCINQLISPISLSKLKYLIPPKGKLGLQNNLKQLGIIETGLRYNKQKTETKVLKGTRPTVLRFHKYWA